MRLFGSALVTLLVIMDPPGNVPVFLAVTRRLSPKEQKHAATLAVLTALTVIVLFAVAGGVILSYLHVSFDALKGSGGLLLLLVSLQLLSGNEEEIEAARPEQRTSIAMVPLGTPLLAGPGAIVAVMVFAKQANGREWIGLSLAILAVHLLLLLVLRYSGILMRVFKETGVLLITRVAGMLLAAIAVQMIADAVRGFVQSA
jgi:multiple antibiotic resistance protein